MKAIIEGLQKQIDYNIDLDEPLNEASWPQQYGIIITVNEAKSIVSILSSHTQSSLSDKIEQIEELKLSLSAHELRIIEQNHEIDRLRLRRTRQFSLRQIVSQKIAEIEKEFTDRKVRPLDPVWVKNEIIKLLKGE